MCGIAGLIRLNGAPLQEAQIRSMVRRIAHRGPDGEGVYLRGNVALGHRRLSIIDPRRGRQPMGNEDGSIWVTYNGEIYNFRQLREELRSRGHVFRTRCDTEVIVHAYEEWGEQCVTRFRGMFAFGLADFANRRLLLARDHFGIKPLYYRLGKGYLAFASEVRAVLLTEPASPPLNVQAFDYYLRYRYIPAPDTAYKPILKLPPATYQVFDFEGKTRGSHRYWQLEFAPSPARTDEEWLEEFEDVLHESVRKHLVADVPFGVFLSGGVDSTLVTREMTRILGPVKAFSIGFSETDYCELPYAHRAARHLGVDLRVEIVQADVGNLLEQLTDHHGEPFADTSMIPTWYVSRLARSEVPMVLSGDGGDELFGGYTRYDRWMVDDLHRSLARFLRRPGTAVRRIVQAAWDPTRARLSRWERQVRATRARQRRRLWRPEFRDLVDTPCPAFVEAARDAGSLDRLAQAQSIDLLTYLPGDILTKVDVASMYHGLEVRTPLTDVRVAEFAARLPLEQRYRAERGRSPVPKWLAKKALARSFPPEFVHRQKQGFGIPERAWLQQGSPLRERFDDLLCDTRSPFYDFLAPEQVKRLVKQFDDGQGHATVLWLLLVLAVWFQCQEVPRAHAHAA